MKLIEKFNNVVVDTTLNIPQEDIAFCKNINSKFDEFVKQQGLWFETMQLCYEKLGNPEFVTWEERYNRGKDVYKDVSYEKKKINPFYDLAFSPLYAFDYIEKTFIESSERYISKINTYFNEKYNLKIIVPKDLFTKEKKNPSYEDIVKYILNELGTNDFSSIGFENLKDEFRETFYRRNEIKITPYKLQILEYMYYWTNYQNVKSFRGEKELKLLRAFSYFDTEDLKNDGVNNFNGDVDFKEPYPIIGNSKIESIKFYKNGKVDIKFFDKDGPQQFYDFFELYKTNE